MKHTQKMLDVTRASVLSRLTSMPAGVGHLAQVPEADRYEFFCYMVAMIQDGTFWNQGFDISFSDDCDRFRKTIFSDFHQTYTEAYGDAVKRFRKTMVE